MEEIKLKIKTFPDLLLRKKAAPVRPQDTSCGDILSSMAQIMYENSGIGLAAPQVGISEAMIVVDIGSGLYKLVNPQIIKREGRYIQEEGCLSIPGVCIKVRRANKVIVQAQDENFKPVAIEAEGLLACVLQHEIDHLKGKLIIDYASFLERLKIRRRLAHLKSLKDEPRPSCNEKIDKGRVDIRKEGRGEELPESETKSQPLQL